MEREPLAGRGNQSVRQDAASWLDQGVSRRRLLEMAGVGGAAALLYACGSSPSPGGQTGSSTFAKGGQVSVGSNQSDPLPKQAMDQINTAFTQANGGTVVKMNTVDHGTFQDQITSYLQGTPEDVFTWFSGERLRFFAAKGLVSPMDDVWDAVKHNFSSVFADSVKGNDGHVYGIPVDYYPWAVFYRKSVFQQHGYKVPTNWDDFKSLATQMKKDGLTPILMGDKDGWEAMGTFDILNLRLNGYDFHTELCTGKQKWTDPRVTKVFQTWSEITPFYNPGGAGMTWQDASQLLVQKTAGMYVLGLFLAQQFQAAGPSELADLDFFPFPDLGTKFDAEKALDAPIDTMNMSKQSRTLKQDQGQANAYLRFWSKGSTQLILFKTTGGGTIPSANDTDTSSYSPLVQKSVQIIKQAKRTAQFFDRDSRPDFAGPNGMQSFLLSYLQNPQGDPKTLQGKMQQFWDSLPPEA